MLVGWVCVMFWFVCLFGLVGVGLVGWLVGCLVGVCCWPFFLGLSVLLCVSWYVLGLSWCVCLCLSGKWQGSPQTDATSTTGACAGDQFLVNFVF